MIALPKISVCIYINGSFDLAELELIIDSHRNARITLKYKHKEITKVATDFFEALCLIRQELENENILILCNGARKDVYPSSMGRQMGMGLKAYVHELGKNTNNIVKIFEKADLELISSVSEQKEFYYKWLETPRS